MMKKSLATILVFIFSILSVFATNPIEGKWNTQKQNTIVEIKNIDGELKGVIVSSESPNAKEGAQIIKDLKPKGDGYEGQLYVAKREKWMDVELEAKGDILEVTVSVGFMSKMVEWTKE